MHMVMSPLASLAAVTVLSHIRNTGTPQDGWKCPQLSITADALRTECFRYLTMGLAANAECCEAWARH